MRYVFVKHHKMPLGWAVRKRNTRFSNAPQRKLSRKLGRRFTVRFCGNRYCVPVYRRPIRIKLTFFLPVGDQWGEPRFESQGHRVPFCCWNPPSISPRLSRSETCIAECSRPSCIVGRPTARCYARVLSLKPFQTTWSRGTEVFAPH